MVDHVCELFWLQKSLEELILSGKGKLYFYCDNKAAISITHNLFKETEQNILN